MMSKETTGQCVLLPCSAERAWVVPQRCLGEIVTISSAGELPPQEIHWRGEIVPVVDFGRQGVVPWRDPRGGSGLVAVVLGRRDEVCRYFGVAVRGPDLGVCTLVDEEIEDIPDPAPDYATAVFRMHGNTYQVPDLLALQRALGSGERFVQ